MSSTKEMPVIDPEKINAGEEMRAVMNHFMSLIINHKKIIVVGDYAFNHLLIESRVLDGGSGKGTGSGSGSGSGNYRMLNQSFFHVISVNYHDGFSDTVND